MKVAELLSRLVNQGDFKFDQYEDEVQVEIVNEDDGGFDYINIKEIFYLSNPSRIIIRLENNNAT